jgi:hypothetical protein
MTDFQGVDMPNAIPNVDADKFWSRVFPTGFCWEWRGAKRRHGYGYIVVQHKQYLAHRVSYALLVGDPGEVPLDHLCRNTSCVNPDHLDPVDTRTNTLRGFGASARNARKQTCRNGHDFIPRTGNESGRKCPMCARVASKESARRKRAAKKLAMGEQMEIASC